MLNKAINIVRRTRAAWTSSLLLSVPALLSAQPAKAGAACDTARKYAHLVQSQHYDQIAALFAPDGVWFTPVGKVMRGREEINHFAQHFQGGARASFRADNYCDDGRVCVMEVSVKVRVDAKGKVVIGADGAAAMIPQGSPEAGVFVRRAIDHFTVDAKGQITRMAVYNAPTTYWRP